MSSILRSPALRTAIGRGLDDNRLTKPEAARLVNAAGADPAARADVVALLGSDALTMTDAARELLQGFIQGQRAQPTQPINRAGRTVGPESPANVGDLVQAPKINWSVREVRSALRAGATPPRGPWPTDAAAQLEYAVSYALLDDKLQDPWWHTATNDSSGAAIRFVNGIRAAMSANVPLAKIEERAQLAEQAFQVRLQQNPALISQIDQLPFPASESLDEQLIWAAAQNFTWDPAKHPDAIANPVAAALVELTVGLSAKRANNTEQTLVKSARKTFDVDGDERVYAVHTPPGPKPVGGWPTVIFFHGSYGGHAPEQQDEYQALNTVAEQRGFQVLYLVGAPQDRNDARTGRGMLNWDPVGTGPQGKNDRFVHELLNDLIGKGDVDKSKVIAAGHSQGGYYVSNLLAAYPDAFAGAAVFGAGPGSTMSQLGPRGTRRTKTYLFVGKDDIHKQSGDHLEQLMRPSYGAQLVYDQPAGRGHEVLPSDYARMFDVLGDEVNASTPLGTLDGKSLSGKDTQPVQSAFRPVIDLQNPPPELLAAPWALQTLQVLAQNPWLNLDNDPARFTVDEWKQSLMYLSTFPPHFQQQIAGMRAFFVTAPPPRDGLDLSRPQNATLWADPELAAAMNFIGTEPALDLDGYPGVISKREVDAALTFKPQLPSELGRGLDKLLALFGPPAPPPARNDEVLPSGAKLSTYVDDRAKQNVLNVLESLSKHPGFAKTISESHIVVTPPGVGLDGVPEGNAHIKDAEGVAMFHGPDGVSGQKTTIIRHDSIERWALGLAHELIHLYHHDMGPQGLKEAEAVLAQVRLPNAQRDDYANAHELFSFFGQWYLAGHGDVIAQKDPVLFAFLQKHLGDARIPDPGWGKDGARSAIDSLYRWFQTGVQQH